MIFLSYEGLEKFNTEKEVAQYVRKAFVDKARATPPAPQSMRCAELAALLRCSTMACGIAWLGATLALT